MFIFKNVNSNNMHLIVSELPPISTPNEKIIKTDIPGGHQVLQSDGFELIDKQCICHYDGNNPDVLLQWLSGAGKVSFGNINDRYYRAYIGNKIPLEQIVRNKLSKFPVIFTCEPFGYLVEGDEAIPLNKATILYNGRNTCKSFPTITIKGNGATTFTINNRSFNITNIGGEITILSEPQKQIILNDKGEYMEGDFPYLDPGENNISWTGSVTSIEIIPYWRTLT